MIALFDVIKNIPVLAAAEAMIPVIVCVYHKRGGTLIMKGAKPLMDGTGLFEDNIPSDIVNQGKRFPDTLNGFGGYQICLDFARAIFIFFSRFRLAAASFFLRTILGFSKCSRFLISVNKPAFSHSFLNRFSASSIGSLSLTLTPNIVPITSFFIFVPQKPLFHPGGQAIARPPRRCAWMC
jgi:hypothetical protein